MKSVSAAAVLAFFYGLRGVSAGAGSPTSISVTVATLTAVNRGRGAWLHQP